MSKKQNTIAPLQNLKKKLFNFVNLFLNLVIPHLSCKNSINYYSLNHNKLFDQLPFVLFYELDEIVINLISRNKTYISIAEP